MLRESLKGVLSDDEAKIAVSAFDQIGGIIIIRIPDGLASKKRIIGEALLRQVKPAVSVYAQSSDVRGDYRTRDLELLAGCDSTLTEYKESGCRFAVDVQNAFVTPRLSRERERIAGLVQDGETIFNMFAGVGMFSIIAARRKKCIAYTVDINPAAHAMCKKSLSMNKLAGQVIPICSDAAKAASDLRGASDRTLMLLPERSDEFLNDAVLATKDGGIIHYYAHVHADRKQDAGMAAEEHYLNASPVRSEILGSKIVRIVGPRYYQTVVDARIRK